MEVVSLFYCGFKSVVSLSPSGKQLFTSEVQAGGNANIGLRAVAGNVRRIRFVRPGFWRYDLELQL